MTAKTSEQREIEKTQREIDRYERERRAQRSAEVAEVAQHVWAQFASAALSGLYGGEGGGDWTADAACECSAKAADCLLVKWMNRFGPPKEDDDGQE